MRRILILLAVIAALPGCKSEPGDELVGNWTGKWVIDEKDMEEGMRQGWSKEVIEQNMQALAKMSAQLELRDDRTYSMRAGPNASNGIWEYEEGQVTLRLEDVEIELGLVMRGMASEDGKTITMGDPTGRQGSTVVFTRT